MEDAVNSIGDFWTRVLESGNPTVYKPLSNRIKHLARTLRVGRFRGIVRRGTSMNLPTFSSFADGKINHMTSVDMGST